MPISLIAPPPTAFDDRGHIDLSQVDKFAAHLSHSGVSGVFLCGSTGEGMSLSVVERKEIAEAWTEVSRVHGLKVIAQVGANSQRDAVDLATHAAKIGVDAVSSLAPCYFRPSTVDQLIEFFTPIAAAANDTPFYFYDIPQLTGVDLPTTKFLQRALPKIPTLAGVKYTNSNLSQLQECIRLQQGRFEIFFGCDEALLAGYVLGARGAIGSTYNFMAPLALRIVEAFDSGEFDLARALQAKIVETVNILAEYGYLVAAKTLMEYYGIDCGSVRPPLSGLSDNQKAEIVQRLTSIGFPFEKPRSKPSRNGEVADLNVTRDGHRQPSSSRSS
jgi:N-acetylneuraminate lyase